MIAEWRASGREVAVVGLGKAAFYAQIDLPQTEAYAYAKEVMSQNALAEDATKQSFARFEFRFSSSALSDEFGFRGDKAAFAGGFEDGGAVAFEVGLDPPQRRHSRLLPGALFGGFRHVVGRMYPCPALGRKYSRGPAG